MRLLTILFSLIVVSNLQAQLTDECKLNFGTNLSGLFDYGTELPFVDLMHNARQWYTKDIGNPDAPFDSGHANELSYRSDGYPTHIPQEISSSNFDQRVVTIWAITDGWPITGHPFGEEPTYAQALLDIQRDTAMYNMYNEWFDFLRTLQEGDDPLQLMNFSFVAERSARYGSWGILETMDQDTSLILAPKYSAILAAIKACDLNVSTIESIDFSEKYKIFPNPTNDFINVSGNLENSQILILNSLGQVVLSQKIHTNNVIINIGEFGIGTYFLQISNDTGQVSKKLIVVE